MKDIHLLVWLSQLGLSVVMPLVIFIFLGVWLYNRFELGTWVIVAGTVAGLVFSIDGLRISLKMMKRQSSNKEQDSVALSFNDHI